MPSVAVVVPELLPVPAVKGGAVEHWVEEAIHRLDSSKYQITVFSRPSGIVDSPGAIHYEPIAWTGADRYFLKLKNQLSWKNPLRYVAKMQNVFSYGKRVAAKSSAFDVIYVHNEPNFFLLMKKKPGQRFVLHMHNDHLSSRLFRALYRLVLAKTDQVICVSEFIRRRAMLAFPEFEQKFSVILNATDPDLFKPLAEHEQAAPPMPFLQAGAKHILYVGRLTEVKGVDVLIKAFGQLYQRDSSLRLIIAGTSFFADAEQTPYVRYLSELSRPFQAGIIFTGFLPHHDLKYLYASVDLLVFPSVWDEPFGLVILESMAAGTCVVASKVGAVPEIIEHEHNGILVEANNPATLALAMTDVLASPEQRNMISTRAREIVRQRFSWGRLIAELDTSLGRVT